MTPKKILDHMRELWSDQTVLDVMFFARPAAFKAQLAAIRKYFADFL